MKTYLVSAVVAVLVVVAGFALFVPSENKIVLDVIAKLKTTLGAIPGADFPYLRETHNELAMQFNHPQLTTGTTTPCNIASPAATSTLLSLTITWLTASSVAPTLQIATSTTQNATTTAWIDVVGAANAKIDFSFTPTTTEKQLFAPNRYLNVGVKGGNGTYAMTGACGARWQEL